MSIDCVILFNGCIIFHRIDVPFFESAISLFLAFEVVCSQPLTVMQLINLDAIITET